MKTNYRNGLLAVLSILVIVYLFGKGTKVLCNPSSNEYPILDSTKIDSIKTDSIGIDSLKIK